MVTTASRAPEVQAVATAIRDAERRLRERPDSAAVATARAGLAEARDLLERLQVPEARARLAAVRLP